MMIEVIVQHKRVGTHDLGTQDPAKACAVQPNGDLVVTDAQGVVTTYPAGKWHAWGPNVPCAWTTPDPTCTRCQGTISPSAMAPPPPLPAIDRTTPPSA